MNAKLHRTGLAVIGLLLVVACSSPAENRVGMKRVSAEFVFGVPPLSESALPTGLPESPPELEPEPEPSPTFRRSTPSPPPPKCPDAGPNDFPDRASPISVEGRPKIGTYTWKLKGVQRVPTFPFPINFSSMPDRSVETVASDPLDAANFTFRTKETHPSPGSRQTITTTFRVDQTNASQNLRGVLLIRIEANNNDGTAPRTFEPASPIMYLPLPIQVGAASAFDSTGVDARNPSAVQTLTNRGFIKERQRVDACGTVIDSWLVDAEQTSAAGTSSVRREYNYSIASQFGGLIVFEHSESPCSSTVQGKCSPDPMLVYDTNIGQTSPR